MPISLQHFLKYSETIKKESSCIAGSQINPSTISLGNLDALNGLHLKGETIRSSENLSVVIENATSSHPCSSNIHHGLLNTEQSHIANISQSGLRSSQGTQNFQSLGAIDTTYPSGNFNSAKKNKKKKVFKEKRARPKPGEIRETKALDGSQLFCCPECQMAYPDRNLIEQHVISHAVERRFVCDVCNAALKRKDHLTRHKLSHVPDRPHICNVSSLAKLRLNLSIK